MIDFKYIADAALASIDQLLPEWLPHGRREGHEYKALNPTRADSRVGSFSINFNTGAWADFATDDKGGDLISLRSFLFGEAPKDAALAIAKRLGVADAVCGGVAKNGAEKKLKKQPARSEFVPVLPVPTHAGEPPKDHFKRGKPVQSWTYRDAQGNTLGLVYRFLKSDGGKDVLPCVFARHAETGAEDWRWLAFPEPRPLYGLNTLKESGTVLVVEGEKCADAARAALGPDTSVSVVSWPGGCKAASKADWKSLAGRKVVLWPDCDAQLDKAGLVKPEEAQSGTSAMMEIAALLSALSPPAEVRLVRIPAPGARPDGWDVADAVAEGWGKQQLLDYIKNNLRETTTDTSQAAPSKRKGRGEGWEKELIRNKEGGVRSVVPNAFRFLLNSKEWHGVLAFDDFAGRSVKRAPPPYERGKTGEWEEADDSFAADWLATKAGLTSISSKQVAEASEMVAKLNTFNPVAEYLDGLKHDGVKRVDLWLSDFLGCEDTPYNRIVGRLWLLGVVKRAYEPGCKFDYMPILEGPQGHMKSTALEVLASKEWFGNTDLKIGDKDSMAALQGKLIYELAELDSFNRADITAIKSYITRLVDEFRPAYGRRLVRQSRRVVFVGTTNQAEYLRDFSGNRRFWPIKVVSQIDVESLRFVRDQLFAEAVILYKSGARVYPTHEEQLVIDPEQRARELSNPWEDLIMEYCAKNSFNEVSSAELLTEALKIDRGRITPSSTTTVGIIMARNGWKIIERRNAIPRRVYRRPQKSEGVTTPTTNGEDDACPF
ncbi:MAG: hypothetical protein LBI35_00815 [Burkholderiales bacterium]|nr:hypothetical protein [Burkholderiales bacterium]